MVGVLDELAGRSSPRVPEVDGIHDFGPCLA